MARPLSFETIRKRIIRQVLIEQRWMSPMLIRCNAGLGRAPLLSYDAALSNLVGLCREDTQVWMVRVFDNRPGRQFWWYLNTELLPDPGQLARRVGPSYVPEGGNRWHRRSTN